MAILIDHPDSGETRVALENSLTASWRAGEHVLAIRQIAEGRAGDGALVVALYAVLASETFTDAIRIAANHDGDSDSTASVAGQIYGVWKGVQGIPNWWARRLDVLEPLLYVADGMIQIWGQDHGDRQ